VLCAVCFNIYIYIYIYIERERERERERVYKSLLKCITPLIYKMPGYFMHEWDILFTLYNEEENECLKKIFH
jgi:hypothetical protein